jgi:hypothetical protein
MSISPVRELHSHTPVPMEQMIRVANRVNLETLLIVIGYAAVMLRLVTLVDWQMGQQELLVGGAILLAMIWAAGMYHARLKWCVADYCGRRPSFPIYCLWPLQSMAIVGGLLLVGGCCAILGLAATLGGAICVTLCLLPSETGLTVALVVGSLPGCIVGFLLAMSVVTQLGRSWLKLT